MIAHAQLRMAELDYDFGRYRSCRQVCACRVICVHAFGSMGTVNAQFYNLYTIGLASVSDHLSACRCSVFTFAVRPILDCPEQMCQHIITVNNANAKGHVRPNSLIFGDIFKCTRGAFIPSGCIYTLAVHLYPRGVFIPSGYSLPSWICMFPHTTCKINHSDAHVHRADRVDVCA